MAVVNPQKFIITRKRKKYRFAVFANSPLCFEVPEYNTKMLPNVLELGAGTGVFSVKLATLHPKKGFLACDVKADRLQKGAQLAKTNKLTNIYFLRAHASQLEEALEQSSLDEIWLTFPDPFPKKRHFKHRLTYPSFLTLYKRLLRKNGKLYLKTDNRNLFDWSLDQLTSSGWQLYEVTYDLHGSKIKNDYKLTTTYEEKFLHQGLAISFVSARPPSVAVTNRQSIRRP